MSLVVGIPLLMFEAIFQSAVFARLPLFGGTLNVVLLTVLSWNLLAERADGLGWAFAGGLFADLLSAGPMGASIIAMLAVGYVAGLTEGRLWRTHFLLPLASALLGTVAFHMIYLVALTVTGYAVNLADQIAYITFPSVFLNMVGILPLYWIIRRLHDWLRPVPVK